MGHQSPWRTTYVIQRKCPWGPGRAVCPAQRTVSWTTGAPGAAAAWWELNPDQEAAASLSGRADTGTSDSCEAHWDLSWYLFPVKNIFSEAQRIQSIAALYYCEQYVNLCQQVISSPPRRNKREIWTGGRWKMASLSPILHCSLYAYSRAGYDLW